MLRNVYLNCSYKINHMQCGHSGFFTLVPVHTTCPFERLLLIVNSEYSKNHRHLQLHIQQGNALCYTLAYIIKVGSIAPDYTAKRYTGIYV